ncbi:MAG: hypothetical protein JJ992_08265, partial [Planctomycetes bacterium]|nr:hypothetical protein [Planctomycetota bacterium]
RWAFRPDLGLACLSGLKALPQSFGAVSDRYAGDVHHGNGVYAMVPGPDGHPYTDGYRYGDVVNTGHLMAKYQRFPADNDLLPQRLW